MPSPALLKLDSRWVRMPARCPRLTPRRPPRRPLTSGTFVHGSSHPSHALTPTSPSPSHPANHIVSRTNRPRTYSKFPGRTHSPHPTMIATMTATYTRLNGTSNGVDHLIDGDRNPAVNSPSSPLKEIIAAQTAVSAAQQHYGEPLTLPKSTAARDARVSEVKLTTIEASKRLAAWTAVDHHVLPHHKVIGIGSGSTVPYVVERIVSQGHELNKDRVFIPTGFQSKELIVNAHLRLGDVDQYPTIDVTIDGADEVDDELNCIKGGGACHLREKVLAEAADTWIVVADYRKNSKVLGTTYKAGVPIEVAPFAYAKLLQNLHRFGSPQATLRMAVKSKAGPVVSDNGNFVIDAPFEREMFMEPHELLTKIKMLTGVVEVGLFCGMARAAYFGNQDGSVTIRWHDGRIEQLGTEEVGSDKPTPNANTTD